ncbi:MAG: RNA 3'-terminal phosphate cyclase [Myxococcota bacterium]
MRQGLAMDIAIDGSLGEGGGQVLRTALSLSAITGRSFRIERIRAGRAKPGLLRQHLTAVHAARDICDAEVEGAELRSRALSFRPGPIRGGTYRFSVGSAGSACLVAQTVLPILLKAGGPSEVRFEGGTHNPAAPHYDFLTRVFFVALRQLGIAVDAELHQHGFYPAGGGAFSLRTTPPKGHRVVEWMNPGATSLRRAVVVHSKLPRHVAERETQVLKEQLGPDVEVEDRAVRSPGPGNLVTIEVERSLPEIITAFGAKGTPAEAVAMAAVKSVRTFLDRNVPVGEYLADQLLLPLALFGGGAFRTGPLSLHTQTNIDVIGAFLGSRISIDRDDQNCTTVRVNGLENSRATTPQPL